MALVWLNNHNLSALYTKLIYMAIAGRFDM